MTVKKRINLFVHCFLQYFGESCKQRDRPKISWICCVAAFKKGNNLSGFMFVKSVFAQISSRNEYDVAAIVRCNTGIYLLLQFLSSHVRA
jgi:hypothetical protein